MTRTPLLLITAAIGALLAACGGGDTPSDPTANGAVRALAVAKSSLATGDPVAPLLDDEGEPMPQARDGAPEDPETRGVRVASPAQASMLAARGAGDVLTLTLDRQGRIVRADGPALAPSTLVFVDGGDLRSAATVARQVAAQGASRVWVIAG